MRIVSWNCRQALRNKTGYLAGFDADVAVVAEAENLERLEKADLSAYPHRVWQGDIAYKGLLVMSKVGLPLEVAPEYDRWLRLIVPVTVGGSDPLTVLAVWTQKGDEGNCSADLLTAIDLYGDRLKQRAIVVGDFNSNAIWDERWSGSATHSMVVESLAEAGLTSLYHTQSGEAQGAETVQTLAFKGDPDKPFHIDFCFVSQDLVDQGAHLEIPRAQEWIGFSDHAPLVIDLP
jgi:exodeoxyribonuclease-3